MSDTKWKTVASFSSPKSKAAAALNQRGDRKPILQVCFGPSLQDGNPGVFGRFLPLPRTSSEIEHWAAEAHKLIDQIAGKSKEILESSERHRQSDEISQSNRRKLSTSTSGLRSLAKKDAAAQGEAAIVDFAQKEVARREGQRSRQSRKSDRAERDRSIRTRMKGK